VGGDPDRRIRKAMVIGVKTATQARCGGVGSRLWGMSIARHPRVRKDHETRRGAAVGGVVDADAPRREVGMTRNRPRGAAVQTFCGHRSLREAESGMRRFFAPLRLQGDCGRPGEQVLDEEGARIKVRHGADRLLSAIIGPLLGRLMKTFQAVERLCVLDTERTPPSLRSNVNLLVNLATSLATQPSDRGERVRPAPVIMGPECKHRSKLLATIGGRCQRRPRVRAKMCTAGNALARRSVLRSLTM